MGYLNWKSSTHPLKRSEHAKLETQLTLTLGRPELDELIHALSQAFEQNTELRLELPEKWTMFWKTREGASRVTLAHPQLDEWVATLILSKPHGLQIIERLRALGSPGDSFSLSHIVPPGVFSNFELVIQTV